MFNGKMAAGIVPEYVELNSASYQKQAKTSPIFLFKCSESH